MKKFIAFMLSAALLFGAAGCQHKVSTAVPEPPSITYQRTVLGAADAVSAVSQALATLDDARKNLATAGTLEEEYNSKYLATLKLVAQKNEDARKVIDAAKGDPTLPWQQQLLDVVLAAKQLDPAAFGIKNPDAQAALASAFSLFQVTIAAVEVSFSAAQGGK